MQVSVVLVDQPEEETMLTETHLRVRVEDVLVAFRAEDGVLSANVIHRLPREPRDLAVRGRASATISLSS